MKDIEYGWVAEDVLSAGLRESDRERISANFGLEGEDLDKVLGYMVEIVKNEENFVLKCSARHIAEKCVEEYGRVITYDDYDRQFRHMIKDEIEDGVWWNATEIEVDDLKDRIYMKASGVINA